MSHATACWITGGKVEGIEVYGNEGGVTKYVGGWRWFIIPAGISLHSYIMRTNIFVYTSKNISPFSLPYSCLITDRLHRRKLLGCRFSCLEWQQMGQSSSSNHFVCGTDGFHAFLSQQDHGASQPWISRAHYSVRLG